MSKRLSNQNDGTHEEENEIVSTVRRWLESIVIDLNLCPFAKRELVNDRIRFAVTRATTEVQLLQSLGEELVLLADDTSVETTLLIHPDVLGQFDAYNQFLELADGLLMQSGLCGVFQIASFHPDYRFGGTHPDDAENYSNRSPYPILHILREASLTRAVECTPDIDQVPARNIEKLNRLGKLKMQSLLRACSLPNHRS